MNTENIPCYICKSNKTKKIHNLKNFYRYKCKNCNVVFIHPHPDSEGLASIYKKEYYHSWGIQKGNVENLQKMKMKTAEAWLEKIEKYTKPGKILDVGCAMGFFMEAAKKRGWEPSGIELSDYSSSIAESKFPGSVYKDKFENINFHANSFDCIVMSDLLEHLEDPTKAIEKTHNMGLSPNSCQVLVETMDFKIALK